MDTALVATSVEGKLMGKMIWGAWPKTKVVATLKTIRWIARVHPQICTNPHIDLQESRLIKTFIVLLKIEVREVILLMLSQETPRGMTKVSAIRIVCH